MSGHLRYASRPLVAISMVAMLAACSQRETPPPAAEVREQPAAEAAPASENAQSFTVGALTATALRDGTLEFPNDNKVFGVGRKPEEVGDVLNAAGLPTDKLQLSVQPLLVKAADRVLLFDTGAASNFGPTAGKLPQALAEAGVDPKSVTDIFISHVHGDHVGGLVDAGGKLVFENADIHLSMPEWDFLRGLKTEEARGIGLGQLAAFVAAVTPKVIAFSPGADIVPSVVKAVEIKGHTPGHSGYLITSGADTLLYIGDAAHHFIVSVQKPEWRNGFDADGAAGAASRKALIEQNAASGQRIYAVHFPFPGVGKFEKRGDGHVWVAE
jgi:glyoxylase-like metal-dependent hydrolase (beta-lactamase superfamily II)